MLLQHLQALHRLETEHPADQSTIDGVRSARQCRAQSTSSGLFHELKISPHPIGVQTADTPNDPQPSRQAADSGSSSKLNARGDAQDTSEAPLHNHFGSVQRRHLLELYAEQQWPQGLIRQLALERDPHDSADGQLCYDHDAVLRSYFLMAA